MQLTLLLIMQAPTGDDSGAVLFVVLLFLAVIVFAAYKRSRVRRVSQNNSRATIHPENALRDSEEFQIDSKLKQHIIDKHSETLVTSGSKYPIENGVIHCLRELASYERLPDAAPRRGEY